MVDNYTKFINGKTFTKNDILKILDENKINGQVIDIEFYHFKQIYIKIIDLFLLTCLINYPFHGMIYILIVN